MANSSLAIDLQDVVKNYKRKAALQGITMQVYGGEVFGLLGPNGAGKSTLVKIIMSVVRPTRCRGTVLGAALGNKPTLRQIGYLPENHRFPLYLTGRQCLHFFGALNGIDRGTRERRAEKLLEQVSMTADADRLIGTYSKGMAQRIGLAQAMMNDPQLLLLDEPTDGVDPVGRRDIRNVLDALRKEGKTVFINSHQLSELDSLCDRVAILINGTVVRQGKIADLATERQRYEIDVIPSADPQLMATLHRIGEQFGQRFWTKLTGTMLQVGTSDPQEVQPVIDALRSAGCAIGRVQMMRSTLEEMFFDAVDGARTGPQPPNIPTGPLPPLTIMPAAQVTPIQGGQR
jgi:ABC-2 type transport system ATP-binding protein